MITKHIIYNIFYCAILTSFCCENIDFDTSMQKGSKEYIQKYGKKDSYNALFLEKLKQSYKQHQSLMQSPQPEPKIPKTIHQIWVGDKPLPEFYKKLTKTWQSMHPDWQYILWTDKEINSLTLYNENLYKKAKSNREKANIARYEILYQFGGVYVDIDFECLKPLDILMHCYDFFTGITPNNATAVLANGLIGSVAQHPLLKKLITTMKNYSSENDQMKRNGVIYFSLMYYMYGFNNENSIAIALPTTYFYPFKKHYGTPIDNSDFIRPESFAIHYWGSTIEQKINLYKQKR